MISQPWEAGDRRGEEVSYSHFTDEQTEPRNSRASTLGDHSSAQSREEGSGGVAGWGQDAMALSLPHPAVTQPASACPLSPLSLPPPPQGGLIPPQ